MGLPALLGDGVVIVREAIAQGPPGEGEYVPGRFGRKRQSLFDMPAS
jgi:hypothetical protein